MPNSLAKHEKHSKGHKNREIDHLMHYFQLRKRRNCPSLNDLCHLIFHAFFRSVLDSLTDFCQSSARHAE
ncbi:MAG TPA: hypothetical protein DDW21_01600 [Verrucomicrobiales bacterium]|nr:MAG: hypothetical protein B9S37_07880 [Verrucomicrobiae bacterium Tous-C3TDCM]PAZ04111.1 MAG: hypothetical protein CAK88_12595 [Verrucomicrobiae bacterium AMD-G2]HBE22161.1 hypothetical protein [Verrucomicrobiales bacterium]